MAYICCTKEHLHPCSGLDNIACFVKNTLAERKIIIFMLKKLFCISLSCYMLAAPPLHAAVLGQATIGIKLVMHKKPTSRPMTVAYVPDYKHYYVADGGLGPVLDGFSVSTSKSEIHAFDAKGSYLNSTQAGLDNRSIYFNQNTNELESVTYNISSAAGFTPDVGIFALELDSSGNLTTQKAEKSGFNPAFGGAGAMPSFDSAENRYYAKQSRSNKVWIVQLDKREHTAEISLDLAAASVQSDDISDSYVAYTGLPGEELAVLDIDHKSILVFNLQGHFVGRSALPNDLRLRANNHYTGLGYANGMFFVYHEPEGEFGTYYGFRISDQAVTQ